MAGMDLKKLIASVVATELIGGVFGSLFTESSLQSWYASLAKPSFTPPGYVIGAVWTVLFLLMGIAFYLIWASRSKSKEKSVSMKLYGLQLFLNVLWSFAFFYLRSPFYGLVEITFLFVAIVATVISFNKVSKNAAMLMIPYLLWVCFAAYLNLSVMLLNM